MKDENLYAAVYDTQRIQIPQSGHRNHPQYPPARAPNRSRDQNTHFRYQPPTIPRTSSPPTTALPIPIPAVNRLPGIETAQHPTSHTYSTSPRSTKSTENVRAHHAHPLMRTATWTASDQRYITLARQLGVAGVACGICMHGGVSQGECGFGSKRGMDFALERRGRFVRVPGLRGSRGVLLMTGMGTDG